MQLLLARKRHASGCRSRRIWFLICTFMLALTAALSLFLSLYAKHFDEALARLMTGPTLPDQQDSDLLPSNWTTTAPEEAPTEGNHPQVFCIVVTVWLVALVVVIVSLWVFVELILWPREAQLIVNIAWFSILYEIYERFVATEQGNIERAIRASSREAVAADAAAMDTRTTAATKNQTSQEKSLINSNA